MRRETIDTEDLNLTQHPTVKLLAGMADLCYKTNWRHAESSFREVMLFLRGKHRTEERWKWEEPALILGPNTYFWATAELADAAEQLKKKNKKKKAEAQAKKAVRTKLTYQRKYETWSNHRIIHKILAATSKQEIRELSAEIDHRLDAGSFGVT